MLKLKMYNFFNEVIEVPNVKRGEGEQIFDNLEIIGGDRGKHCYIIRSHELVDKYSKLYGVPVVLKIFDAVNQSFNEPKDLNHVTWGPYVGHPQSTLLLDATQIQAIASWYNLAPRVFHYSGIRINQCGETKWHPFQIVEDALGEYEETVEERDKVYYAVIDLGKEYAYTVGKKDVSFTDVKGGKLLDFQTLKLEENYPERVVEIYRDKCKYGKIYYQSIPNLGLNKGPRKSDQRIEYLGLERIDFKNKRVLDLGCSGGFFCRYAIDRGAAYVRGVDEENTIMGARTISNYLGYHSIDYQVQDIPKGYDEGEWDIVLFLSMIFHVPIPKVCKESQLVVFEDNSEDNRHKEVLGKPWTDWFNQIQYIGRAKDHGDKAIYHLKKLNS